MENNQHLGEMENRLGKKTERTHPNGYKSRKYKAEKTWKKLKHVKLFEEFIEGIDEDESLGGKVTREPHKGGHRTTGKGHSTSTAKVEPTEEVEKDPEEGEEDTEKDSGPNEAEQEILDSIEKTVNGWTGAQLEEHWEKLKKIDPSIADESEDADKTVIIDFFNKELFPPSATVYKFFPELKDELDAL
jgi:hypothetical protein